jgi:DNA-binding PadR family transcriptional regulator
MMEQLAGFGLEENDPSALYRALRDMEERGWLTSFWEEEQTQGPPRRIYRLTELGNEVLSWWTQDVRETSQIIDRLLETYTRHMEEGKGDYH